MATSQAVAPVPESGPYVGPRPFETGEPIFGRDRETTDLYYKLSAERIVLLPAPSGAGKSSLIQAGLIPRMREEFDVWRPTRVNTQRPADVAKDVNRYVLSAALGFEQGVPASLRRAVDRIASQTLAEYVQNRPRRPDAPENVLLILDQFEEILTIDPLQLKAKEDFFDQLGVLLRDRRIWALISMREDYLGALDPYTERVPTHLKNRFRIDRLDRTAAADAIARPARAGGRPFGEKALGRLVKDLSRVRIQQPDGSFEDGDGLYVEPLQLQVVCSGMWKAMPPEDSQISVDTVEKYGNVSGALANYYDAELVRIAGENKRIERDLREWVDSELILAGGIRGQVLKEKDRTKGLDNTLIGGLENAHLIRGEQRAGATWFELAHDRLIEPVQNSNREWLKKNLEPVEETAAVWAKEGHPDGLLFLGADLAKAVQWAAQNPDAKKRETDFIEASEKKQRRKRREQRRATFLRWALAASLLLLVVAVVGIVSAIRARAAAEKQKEAAVAASTIANDMAEQAKTARGRAEEQTTKAVAATEEAHRQAEEANRARVDSAITNASYVLNPQLRRYRMDSAAAYLASALRADSSAKTGRSPGAKIARYWLSNLLLYGNWMMPGKITARAELGGSINFSDDGRFALVQDSKKKAEVRDTVKGTTTAAMMLDDFVADAWFSPGGEVVLIAFRNTSPQLWKADGRSQHGLPFAVQGKPLNAPFRFALFSKSGKWLVTSSDAPVKTAGGSAGDPPSAALLWQVNPREASLGGVKPLGKDPLEAAAFSPDEAGFAVSVRSGSTRFWRTSTNEEVSPPLKDDASSMAFSPNGRYLVTTRDNAVRVWDAVTHKLVGPAINLTDIATSATFSGQNEKWLVTSCYDGTVRVWDFTAGRQITTLLHDSPVYFAKTFPDTKADHLVFTRSANSAQLWMVDAKGGAANQSAGSPFWDSQPLQSATVIAPSRFLTTSGDGTDRGIARLWQPAKPFTPDPRVAEAADSQEHAKLSSDGRRFATIWTEFQVLDIKTLEEIGKPIEGVFQSSTPDLKLVLTIAPSRTSLELRDSQSGDLRAEIKGKGRIRGSGLSRDGTIMVALSDEITVHDVAQRKKLAPIPDPHSEVYAIALSGDGRILLTASRGGAIRFWDTSTGKVLRSEMNTREPNHFLFSEDDRRVVAWSGQAVWNYGVNGRSQADPVTVQGTVILVRLSHDGRKMVTGTDFGTAEIWDTNTGRSISGPLPHDGDLNDIAFSPDGLLMATAYGMNIQLWDLQTGKRIGQPLDNFDDEENDEDDSILVNASFSPDGDRLFTFDNDGVVRVWPMLIGTESSGELLARLAEAISGSEVSRAGILQAIPYQELERRKEQLRKDGELKRDAELLKVFKRLFPDDRVK